MIRLQKSILFLILLLVVGCAGQGDQTADTPTTEPPTAEPEPTAETPEAPTADAEPAASNGPSPEEGADTADVDTFIDRITAFGYSGLTLVAQDGEIIHSSSHGLANREADLPPTDRTLFDIGSVTKLFTAVAILQLESQGLLSVEDPISDHLDDVPDDKTGITIHHLLTHSSGLDAHHSFSDFDPMTKAEAWETIRDQELLFPPGEFSEYSNSGYTVLALIIEAVSGQSYQEYVQTNLFEPANMVDSGFYGDARWTEADVAKAYIGEEDFGSPLTWEGPYWGLMGNGGIVSTLSDLYQWHLALQNDTLLDESAKSKLWEPHLPMNDEGVVYEGYGWVIVEFPDIGRLGILSGGDGFDAMNAHYRHYQDSDTVIITLSNDGQLPGEILARPLGNFIHGQGVGLPPAVGSIEPNLLAHYEGVYQLPSGDKLIVQQDDGKLTVGAAGQGAIGLLASDVPEPNDALLARAQEILEGFNEEDYDPAYDGYGGEISLADLEDFFGNMWAEIENEHGELEGFSPLGLDFSFQGDLAANILGEFERGSVIFKLYWFNGRLVGVEATEDYPAATQFWPQSDTVFVTYDFFSGESRMVHFIIEDGRVASLTIAGVDGGEITAEKIE